MPQNEQNPYGFDYDPDWRNRGEAEETDRGFVDPQVVPPTTQPAEDFSGTYGFDYQPNWRDQQAPMSEDEYGWGLVNAWRRGMERLSAMPDVAQGDYEELAQHFGNLEQYKMSDEDMAKFEELRNTEGWWAKLGGLLQNPRLIGQVVAESLPMMAAPIVGATGGSIAGGAIGSAVPVIGTAAGGVGGMMAGGAAGSYMTEYYASIGDFFGQQGVNMTNPAELKAAFDNEQLMQQAREHARARGIPIAIFDALSMGLAGRIAKPVSGVVGKVTGGRRIGAGTAGEIGMQAGLGAAGEAGAQLMSEGEISDELDVLLEGVAEIVPGVAEAGVSRMTRKRAGIADPNDSPLAALDRPDEGDGPGGGAIPETDIDMRTGKVITRTGDEEYDQLDRALEQASVELELDIEMASQARELAEAGAQRAAEIQGSRNMQMIEMEQERDAQLAKQGRLEEARKAAEEDRMWQEQATAGIEDVGAAESEMLTPQGVPVEGEPIDVAGGQPAAEGALRPEGIVPPGGRPFGTSLAEKLIEAGVRPPERPQEPPAGQPGPERGPDVTAREAAASEALMREEEQRALDEEAEAGYPDIPFTDEEIAARRPPDDEGPPGGQPPPPASTAVEKPKPEPEITEAVAEPVKPATPKPTKRPNYARDNFITTRAKSPVNERLSMEKFEAEGLDIQDMREKVYGGKPAFSRHPDAMGPDDVAEYLNENNYPNPFDNGSIGTWDANQALEAVVDEMAGVSEILTGQAIETRAEEARYEEELAEFERQQEEEAAPAGGEQLDMMPEPTGRDAQVTRDQRQREREAAAPEADMGVAGDLFTGTSAESRQAAEMEAAQMDVEETAKPEFDITKPEGRMASAEAAVAKAEKAFADATPEERMMFDSPVSKALEEARAHLKTIQAQQVEGEVIPAQQYPVVQIMEDKDGVTVSFGGYERTYADLDRIAAEAQFRKDFADVLGTPEGRAAAAGVPAEELDTGGEVIQGETDLQKALGKVSTKMQKLWGQFDGNPAAIREYIMSDAIKRGKQGLIDELVTLVDAKGRTKRQIAAQTRTAEETLTEEEAREQERADFEARQAQLRDTGETTRKPEEIIAEIEANIPTMKGPYGQTFGDMGRPRLVTAFRQLEGLIGENEDFDAVLEKVTDKITYKPTRDAFLGAINASPETNLLVADIERQHESWRQEVIETDWMKLDTDEINRNNARIDELAEMGDPRAIDLVKEADHWMNKDRITAKSSHPRFKQSRKSNKFGGITDIRGRDNISLDAAQLSASVDYDSLTFKSPEDQARADRILEVIDKVAGQIEPTPEPQGTPPETAEEATHVDSEGNVTFEINEEQFNEVIEEMDHIAETPAKKDRKAIDTPLKNGPFIPLKEAQKKVDEWARLAREQADQPTYRKDVEGYAKDDYGFNPMDNSQRVVISLFDYTGQWARPWAEAGYDVYTFDIKSGQDAMDFSIEWFANEYNFDKEIYAILAAPPCTTFSNSGTRWRKSRHDAKSKEVVEEMWGPKAVEQGFEVPNEYGKELVHQTMRVIEYFRPKVWALENPEGRIESQALFRGWRTAFQPHNFGDPYTKRTLLWGKFNEDLPTANVKPTEGSKMHKMSPSEERAAMRSETPEGFSYAFFMANNYNDRPLNERLPLEFNEIAGAVQTALEAGMTEPEIRNAAEDLYLNEDYEAAQEALRQTIEPPPTTPPSRPRGIGYKLETEIMSKSPVELSKRDKIDLQAIALRLGLDDTGGKIDLAKRIKDFVASTPAAREARLAEMAEPVAEGETRTKQFMLSPSIMTATRDGLMPGITQTRMNRIAENFAKVGDRLLSNVTTSDRKFIKPDPFTEISFSEFDDHIRINSVNLSGLGTANTTRPDVYDSRKSTHIKKALIALDQRLQSLVRYQEETPTALDIARAEADTNTEATEDQKKAGNYKKGRVPLPLGMEFHIETPEGEIRYGNQKLKDPYGGFTGTKGMDGDPVDGFLNKKIEDDWRGDVYIVDQVNPETKKFDEHKVMFGYNNAMDARRAYKRNFQKDWKGTGNVTIMPIETFKQWLDTPGATKKPAAEFGTTDAAKKAREESNKDQRYATGKDMLNSPSLEFTKKVLEGGEKRMGDIPDTMPLAMAVDQLLKLQAQPAGFQAPEAPAYMPDSEEIEAALQPLEDRMPGAPVKLLFDYRQAPEIVQRAMEADGMTSVPAVYSPVTNEIYLFTTRIDSTEHAIQLALHEKTHQGLREAFGAELDTILENVYENASPQDVAYMMDLSGRYNKNMNILEDQLVLAEELIAYKAETDPQNNIVQRVVAFIKKWLRKAGLRLEYSDADITAIIAEAQNAIARRDSYGSVMLTEDVEVAETGEVYEVETPATDALDAVDRRIAMCEKVKKCL